MHETAGDCPRRCPDPLWESLARADDDATFFQTPVWHRIAARHFGAESFPLLFDFPEGPACLPLLRDRRWGRWRWFSPFGTYTAPLCPRMLGAEEIRAMETALRPLTLQLTSSPFSRNPVRCGKILPSRIQVVDLDNVDADNPARDWEEGQRRRVRVARREGVAVRLAASREDWESYFDLYGLSVRRWGKKATTVYPRSLLNDIRGSLGEHPGVRLWLAERGGEIGAGYLTFYHNRHVVPWHGAADARFFQWGATQALFHEIIADARRGGYSVFDLTGSGGLSGVEAFKGRFGTRTITFDSCVNRPGIVGALAALRDRFRGAGN